MATKRPNTVAVLSAMWICIVVMAGGNVFKTAEAIWLTVPTGSGIKCVSEEIQGDVLVVGDYFPVDQTVVELAPAVDVRVTSPHGNEMYSVKNSSYGQFAFTAKEAGTYEACFTLDAEKQKNKNPVIISLDWKIGIKAKDWASIAKKEKLEGIELDLRRHKELAQLLMRNMIDLSIKEAMMRNLNEETNRRVSQLSIMSMLVCILVSVLQVWHLKRFFHKKKLI